MRDILEPLSQEILDEILRKDVGELTPDDKGFLRARRSYLTPEQAEFYQSVLTESPEQSFASEQKPVKLDRNALMKEAKELGIKLETTFKAERVKSLIDNYYRQIEIAEEERLAKEAANKEAGEAAAKLEQEKKDAKGGHTGNLTNANKYQDDPNNPVQ